MSIIELRNITKEYELEYNIKSSLFNYLSNKRSKRKISALNNINLTIDKGQTIGIIGRNGSGKTTLLKLLSRITKPTRGSINIDGNTNSILELGAGFHPELTGRENIYLNAALSGIKKTDLDPKIESIIDFADIGDFINMPLRAYSDGMRLRLGFAIASHIESDIFLIDEVLSVGDAYFQEKCFDRISQLKKRKKSIIFASHNLGIIRKMCDKVIFLEKGQILDCGSANETVEKYLIFLNREFKRKELKAERLTSDINIIDVYFKNINNETKRIFEADENIIIRIEYSAKERIYQPVFGIGVYHKDIYLVGPNTRDHNFKIDYVEKEGAVEYKMKIPFACGRYKVSASIHNLDETHCYDYLDRVFEFEVKTGAGDIRYGLFNVKGEWSMI